MINKIIKKKLGLILLCCTLAFSIAGCSSGVNETAKKNSKEDTKQSRVITDLVGRQVEIKDDVKSIIPIPWPWASIVFAVDGKADRIAAFSKTAKASYENCMFQKLAPKLADSNTNYIADNAGGGNFGKVNFEEMAKINPDFVMIYEAGMGDLQNFKTINIPVAVFKYGTLKDVQDGITLLGKILHQEDRAATIIKYQKEASEQIEAKSSKIPKEKKPTVMFLRNKGLSVDANNFNTVMISSAGGINVTDGMKTGAVVSMEQIMKWDPDIILLSNFDNITPDDLYNNKINGKDWSKLKAVKNKKVYKVPMGLYRWDAPSAENNLMLEWLAKVTNPDVFKDVSLRKNISEFYKKLFNYDLSKEELDMILHSKMNSELGI